MKKLIVFFLIAGLVSCNSQEKKKETKVVEHVNVEQFQKLMGIDGAQLVDVRTVGEFKAGHLKNAILIDFYNGGFMKQSLEKLDKTKPVLVYCRSGNRSANAARMYKDAGFTKVYDLLGGIGAWYAKNLEIVK